MALALAGVALAAARPRLTASFRLVGSRLTVTGSIRGRLAGGRRVVLQQQVSGAWTARASFRLKRGRGGHSFKLTWTAPATATALDARVVMRAGGRTLLRGTPRHLTVATHTTGPAACGGETPPPPPGGGSWKCTFDDEFDAATGDPSSLNTAWWVPQVTATSAYTTGPLLDPVCYVNSPNNISVSGGALHLTVRKEAAPFSCGGLFTTQYTGGMVSTYRTFSQTYGRFEVRAMLPSTAVKGLQETLWLWPLNDKKYGSTWPDSGEVDFSEFYSEYPTLDIPYIHYNYDPQTVDSSTHTNTVTAADCPIQSSQYNDYAVVWSPGSFTITINGNTCLIDNYLPDNGLTSPEPFDQPFFIALTQALGVNTNAFDPSTTPLPATTSIEYVRVWS